MKLKALFLISIISVIGCGKYEFEDSYLEDTPGVYYQADRIGNIEIVNKLDKELLLYVGDSLFSGIPALNEAFILKIPSGNDTKTLKIWKREDVDDLSSPDNNKLFRRWDIILTSNYSEDQRAKWIIREEGGLNSGTLSLSYPDSGQNDIPAVYSVDVILNSETGEKLVSLNPGTQDKQVGIRYGYHILYFHYWYSDPDSPEGVQEIGWIKKNANGENFEMVINSTYNTDSINIPVYYNSSVGKAGKLNVVNHLDSTIVLFANDEKISNHIVGEDANESQSYVQQGKKMEYLLKQDVYNIKAVVPQTNETVFVFDSCSVTHLYETTLRIENSLYSKKVSVQNHTGFALTFHNAVNENYIGQTIEPNQITDIKVADTINSLKAINTLNDKFWIQNNLNEVWIIEDK